MSEKVEKVLLALRTYSRQDKEKTLHAKRDYVKKNAWGHCLED